MLTMTRRFVLAALPVAAFVVMTAPGAAASDLAAARVSVPFAFDLNGKQFEAGHYRFESRPGSGILTLAPENGAPHMLLGRPLSNAEKNFESKLVFYFVDNTYYLAEVWFAGSSASRGLPVKKEIAITAKNGKVKRIEVALNR